MSSSCWTAFLGLVSLQVVTKYLKWNGKIWMKKKSEYKRTLKVHLGPCLPVVWFYSDCRVREAGLPFKMTFHGCWPCGEMGKSTSATWLAGFSDYWFPSPVRLWDRSVGFGHGGHILNSPSEKADHVTVDRTSLDRRLTDVPELLFSVLFFISPKSSSTNFF